MPGPAAPEPRTGLVRLAAADLSPVPWRNGAGLTCELAAGPGWRLSLADLTAPAPFSAYPGSDRVHVPLGVGYPLEVDGRLLEARPLEPVCFAGEVPVVLPSLPRPTTALNLITRRADCAGSLVVVRHDGATRWPPYVRAVVLLDGPSPVVVTGPSSLALQLGDALVAEVHIYERTPAPTEENQP